MPAAGLVAALARMRDEISVAVEHMPHHADSLR
jgi:hypothetical protein